MNLIRSRHFVLSLISALVIALPASALKAQETDPRVSPVNRPLPAGGAPFVPMTGAWRFSLTDGVMLPSGAYFSKESSEDVFTASSHQGGSIPMFAFNTGATENDGSKWCASNGDMPQWVQADLGAPENVAGMEITWEKDDATYQCKIEGSMDGSNWNMLVDKTAPPGVGNGKLTWTPAQARYVRVTVTKANAKPYGWACFGNAKIHVLRNGVDTIWKSSGPTREQVAAQDKFADPSFADTDFKDMTVPSNWEMLGYSQPKYGGVDDTVGLYRRVVAVPASFSGQRIYWRFDGVFESAEVFVNGKRVGYHESGFTAFDVDLTGFVKPGQPNLFAVRVCKLVPSYDMETGDFEALGGIYRNNFLYAVPPTNLSDITVRTSLDPQYTNATLATDLEVMGQPGQTVAITGSLGNASDLQARLGQPFAGSVTIGQDGKGKATISVPVEHPQLWSAEKPNLYKLNVAIAGERIQQTLGFRQIDISPDHVLLWNGVPIKCAGTCRHEIYPTLGSALNDEIWLKDISLIKGANINAIRTSHYNHASRFLDLCDQHGFYLLDEIPFCWINEKVSDPAFLPALLLRSLETYERDKNRPGVLAWSCGNENPKGSNEQEVLNFMHAHDPTRPAFVSCMGHQEFNGQTFSDGHYPGPDNIENDAKGEGQQAPIIYTEQPHIFWQQTWQKYDPGVSDLWGEVISKSFKAVDSHAPIVGSFIWEWQDQPVADKFDDNDKDKTTGLRYQNNKGIVTGYRVPKPEYWAVKMAYSQVKIDPTPVQPAGGTCPVSITNRYSFTNLNELKCSYEARAGNVILKRGDVKVECAPLQSTSTSFPAPTGMTALQITFSKPSGDLITGAVLKVAGAPDPKAPMFNGTGGALAVQEGDAPKISNTAMQVEFDAKTGQLSHWHFKDQDLITGVSEFNLGENYPNDDTGQKEFVKGEGTLSLTDAKWTTTKKDDNSVEATSVATVNVGSPSEQVGTLTTTYSVHPDAEIGVHWTLDWKTPNKKAWEIGQKLMLPSTFNKLTWWRDSVFNFYPADHLGIPYGHCTPEDVRFRASKRNLHWLTLTDASGAGLALLQMDTPLIGRANSGEANTTLFASLQEAGPQDFSGSWVENHMIHLEQGKATAGGYMLRPAVATGPVAAGN